MRVAQYESQQAAIQAAKSIRGPQIRSKLITDDGRILILFHNGMNSYATMALMFTLFSMEG